jgi:hypothetical protein
MHQAAERWHQAEEELQKEAKNATLEATKPSNRLRIAYAQYIFVKRCYDARLGYLTIYISESELARAKRAASRIEEKLKPNLPSDVTTDGLWSEANAAAAPDLPLSQQTCQTMLGSLEQAYAELVPKDRQIKKDF